MKAGRYAFGDGLNNLKKVEAATAGLEVKFTYLEEPQADFMRGFDAIQSVIKRHPELLTAETPGENLEERDLLSLFRSNIAQLGSAISAYGKIRDSRKEAEKSVAYIDVLLDTMRTELRAMA